MTIEEISFRLTADELAEQERTVAALRACAGTVLAAASVANSFLAASGGHGVLDGWAVAAMSAFVLCSTSTIRVLMPHPFVFAFRGAALLRTLRVGSSTDLAEAYRAVEAWIEPQLHANRRRITLLEESLTASCLLLALEVFLWTVAILS
ncbi:MAG TPA: hypothetical protein VGI52_01050 [Solirubrobacteraceae bacterium]